MFAQKELADYVSFVDRATTLRAKPTFTDAKSPAVAACAGARLRSIRVQNYRYQKRSATQETCLAAS